MNDRKLESQFYGFYGSFLICSNPSILAMAVSWSKIPQGVRWMAWNWRKHGFVDWKFIKDTDSISAAGPHYEMKDYNAKTT